MKPQLAEWVEQLAKPATFAGKSDGYRFRNLLPPVYF